MPLFAYRAVTSDGEEKAGTLDSADEFAVAHSLQSQGLIPLSIAKPQQGSDLHRLLNTPVGGTEFSKARLLIFTEQLASLMQAGISLDRALEIMINVSDDPKLQTRIVPIQEGVRRGQALSGVLAEQPGIFSSFYISMIQAAEAYGDLGKGLQNLAAYLTRSQALRDNLLSALIYPIILVVVSVISLLIILVYVVPQFEQLFAGMNKSLPLSTTVVLSVAAGIKEYGLWALAVILPGMVLLRYQLQKTAQRESWDNLKLRLPLLGRLIQSVETARFCRSLGTLLHGGVPLLSAMGIARQTLTNTQMTHSVDQAAAELKAGKHLTRPLQNTRRFPSLAIQMIQVGEETGQLDVMLIKVADLYDRQVANQTQRLLAVLTPALIVGLGIMIAGIIISILAAIMSINDIPI
ncbi:type II secretion system F family protein [Aliamphritea hakodatensis]|uniref:type II secretion system F family protein n=1 Tax=Aliamphritea hakodatensis TaxID=2895352 RepID=UPI0022FD450F|nr:type II secretion system F family protein [Aliamphritea hakodatensis]